MTQSRSILHDLDIDPNLMFAEPEKFQELCQEAADYLYSVMQGHEASGNKKARELINLVQARTNVLLTNKLPEKTRDFKYVLDQEIWDLSNGRDSSLSSEDLIVLSMVLQNFVHQINDHIAERFNEDNALQIKSKRTAASMYQKLRVLHDKWREAMKLMNETNWKVIPGRPGNFKDDTPFIFYLFNGEEFHTWHYIVRCLSEHFDTSNIKNTGDFHDFVEKNPDCNVRIVQGN